MSLLTTMGRRAPVANFTGSPLGGTTPLSVAFTNTSQGAGLTYLWQKYATLGGWTNFTSGATSANPTESFDMDGSVGTRAWDVRLTVTNASGSNTKTRTGYITVDDGGGPPG